MSVYQTAYQTVTAGRVREDEVVTFLGQNKLSVPSGVRTAINTGNSKEPTIAKGYLDDRGTGKAAASRDPQLGVYVGGKYNAGT